MAKYKLLAGRHIGPHPDYELQEDGTYKDRQGRTHTVAPDMVYGQGTPGGIIVESDIDLVQRFGAKKFAYMGTAADPGKRAEQERDALREMGDLAEKQPGVLHETRSVFPAGQVLEGVQVTTTGADGRAVSAAMTPDSIPLSVAEKRQRHAEQEKAEKEGGMRARAEQPRTTVPRPEPLKKVPDEPRTQQPKK